MKLHYLILLFSVCMLHVFAHAQNTEGMAKINGGSYVPLYGDTIKTVVVNEFYLDKYPVTVSKYLQFVKKEIQYTKTNIKRLFAEESYLLNWKNNFEPSMNMQSPVTYVSWFAAKEYCECQGKRLPTVDEWEYAARANEYSPDARNDSMFNDRILSWYEKPIDSIKSVGTTFINYWGVSDMHALVWEWTMDFNSVMITGEGRNTKTNDTNLFCGAAAFNATDLRNYAAFMRYALRGSLKANYALKNLGFRCAKSVKSS